MRGVRLLLLSFLVSLIVAPVAAQSETGPSDTAVADERAPVEIVRFATLPAAPVALVRYDGGTAALLLDGQLVATGPAGMRTLRRGLDGETLVACDGRLLVLDGTGRLGYAVGVEGHSPLVGPAVSLHATPACLSDGTIVALDPSGDTLLRLSRTLQPIGRTRLAMLPDAAPMVLAGDLVAVLIDPTLRYRHGVLGDEVEPAGVAIVDPIGEVVLAAWHVGDERVIEERRVVAFAAAGAWGLVATVSGAGDGGALVVLAADDGNGAEHRLAPVSVASGLGQEQGQRWRHVLGSAGDRLYSVAAPHLGGPLERWQLPPDGGILHREAFELAITSHIEGRRALDLGQLLPPVASDPDGLDLLLLPARNLTALRLVGCDAASCRVLVTASLGGRLATAPQVQRRADGQIDIVAGREDGGLLRIRVPHDRILTNPE